MAWCRSHAELDSASNDFFASQVLVQCLGASLVRMVITASQTHRSSSAAVGVVLMSLLRMQRVFDGVTNG